MKRTVLSLVAGLLTLAGVAFGQIYIDGAVQSAGVSGAITNEVDPVWSAVASLYATTNWVISQNYLTTYVETDPVWAALFATGGGNSNAYLTGAGTWVSPTLAENDPVFLSWLGTNTYIQTETDPIWSAASNLYYLASNPAGYITNYVETDPIWSAVSNTVTDQAADGATAFSWGNHALVGYLTSYTETDPIWSAASNLYYLASNPAGYITNYTETDPYWAAVSNDISIQAAAGAVAFGWGDHAAVGYITNYTETDPYWAAVSNTITIQAAAGAVAFGWGDHSLVGYLTSYTETDPLFTNFLPTVWTPYTNSVYSELTNRYTIAETKNYVTNLPVSTFDNDVPYLITETDPLFTNWLAGSVIADSTNLVNGLTAERHALYITNIAGTVYAEIEQIGGGDLTYFFNGSFYTLDCTTGAGIGGRARSGALVSGTDTNPVVNFMYVVPGAGTTAILTNSTTIPSGAFAWVGRSYLKSAASTLADGPLALQRATEAVGHNGRGAIAHERERIRTLQAEYLDGVDFTVTDDAGGNITWSSTPGQVYQMHRQTFPAFVDPAEIVVINDPTTPYRVITNFNQITEDATGTAIGNGRFFGVHIYGYVASGDDGVSRLYATLPSGQYTSANVNGALTDSSGFDVNYLPQGLRGGGFSIARVVIQNAAGTYALAEGGAQNLRGFIINSTSGGGAGAGVSQVAFQDNFFNVYDDGDPTKRVFFEASQLTTATDRTITVPDASGTMALIDLAQNWSALQTFEFANVTNIADSVNEIVNWQLLTNHYTWLDEIIGSNQIAAATVTTNEMAQPTIDYLRNVGDIEEIYFRWDDIAGVGDAAAPYTLGLRIADGNSTRVTAMLERPENLDTNENIFLHFALWPNENTLTGTGIVYRLDVRFADSGDTLNGAVDFSATVTNNMASPTQYDVTKFTLGGAGANWNKEYAVMELTILGGDAASTYDRRLGLQKAATIAYSKKGP